MIIAAVPVWPGANVRLDAEKVVTHPPGWPELKVNAAGEQLEESLLVTETV